MKQRRPRSRWTARLLSAVAIALLLAACGIPQPAVPTSATLSQETVDALEPQPPALPGPTSLRDLPEPRSLREGTVLPYLGTQALSTARVALRSLVIGATADDPAVAAWVALLDQAGIPHDVLIATDQPLTTDVLVEADGTGKYQAILLATNNLSYDVGGGTFDSAFTSAEWNLLWQYERDFAVRQVALYTFPGDLPESYGIEEAVPGTGGPAPDGYTVRTTATGQQIFSYLADSAEIPVRNAWVYRSRLTAGSTAVPLLVDDQDNVLAVASTSPDGRERLASRTDQAGHRDHAAAVPPREVRGAARESGSLPSRGGGARRRAGLGGGAVRRRLLARYAAAGLQEPRQPRLPPWSGRPVDADR